MEIPRIVVTRAVDEHGWRAGHPIAAPFVHVLLDAPARVIGVYIPLKALHIETERARELEHVIRGQRRLVLIEPVVHVPEAILFCGRFRRPSKEFGARMRALVREVTEDIRESFAEGSLQLRDDTPQAPAIGAEIVR